VRRREAAHGGVGVEVYDRVDGQCGQDRPEFGHKFRLVVGDEQLDVAVVLAGCDVEWDDEVSHGVEEVGAAAAGREDHRWHVVPHRALGRDHEAVRLWRGGPDGDLPNPCHGFLLPLPRVRPDCDGRVVWVEGG